MCSPHGPLYLHSWVHTFIFSTFERPPWNEKAKIEAGIKCMEVKGGIGVKTEEAGGNSRARLAV